ncbi:hypothetical protein FOA52_008532 [Chlamydomonas sp. UWO 241]|nr:hypothetical protein FOA52_008532 [Chlamydomonas sp. UWO 241]
MDLFRSQGRSRLGKPVTTRFAAPAAVEATAAGAGEEIVSPSTTTTCAAMGGLSVASGSALAGSVGSGSSGDAATGGAQEKSP